MRCDVRSGAGLHDKIIVVALCGGRETCPENVIYAEKSLNSVTESAMLII